VIPAWYNQVSVKKVFKSSMDINENACAIRTQGKSPAGAPF
jgi:hypothetical protein